MNKIGIISVDGHHFPNFALLKIAGYYQNKGIPVEWVSPLPESYDTVYASKVFTFTPEYDYDGLRVDWLVKGGTGYDIGSRLPSEIEESVRMDYSIYPQYRYSLQFFSRGCIRHCPFCLVHEKEGGIRPAIPVELNPQGEWIEVLDNNFFANPDWRSAVEYLKKQAQPVNFHGVDIRIMDEEQAFYLSKLKLKKRIHIAWDLPEIDLREKLKEVIKYIKPYKICCYVLVGFNSTMEQDLYRIKVLKELGIMPFVQPYRDFGNKRTPSGYEKDLAHWVNKVCLFKSCDFEDFSPRKGFRCGTYLEKTDNR